MKVLHQLLCSPGMPIGQTEQEEPTVTMQNPSAPKWHKVLLASHRPPFRRGLHQHSDILSVLRDDRAIGNPAIESRRLAADCKYADAGIPFSAISTQGQNGKSLLRNPFFWPAVSLLDDFLEIVGRSDSADSDSFSHSSE